MSLVSYLATDAEILLALVVISLEKNYNHRSSFVYFS